MRRGLKIFFISFNLSGKWESQVDLHQSYEELGDPISAQKTMPLYDTNVGDGRLRLRRRIAGQVRVDTIVFSDPGRVHA